MWIPNWPKHSQGSGQVILNLIHVALISLMEIAQILDI